MTNGSEEVKYDSGSNYRRVAYCQTQNGEKTIIAISEHYSQVLHSYQGVLRSMDKNEHIQLLNRHVDYLEQQYNWIDLLGNTKSSNGVSFYITIT
ncbi:hypothetical protein [Paenibacillus terrae]|uniref:hypothetical protein n=1 Tax=Paenibacillus terrae TaxID=159743 RepID=UPI000A936A98|nr:hypothetical protein [Paenibacillus terrae]